MEETNSDSNQDKLELVPLVQFIDVIGVTTDPKALSIDVISV